MSANPSRPTSPSSVPFVRTFRFSTSQPPPSQSGQDRAQRRNTKTPDELTRTRSSSLRSVPTDETSGSPPTFSNPFTAHASSSGSFINYDSANPSPSATQALASIPKRSRGSFLLAASNLSFSRPKSRGKKKAPPSAPTPFVFSEVIEISAPPPREDEDEERERLRDAAAQSLGLDKSRLDSSPPPTAVHDDEPLTPTDVHQGEQTPTPRIPSFPSTHGALEPFIILSSRIAKHYPPPSLLMFALSRQWKMRLIVLTSTATGKGAGAACLHVFKSGSADERELERVEIGPDINVFVSEEEVGGRRGVVKVDSRPGTEMTLHVVDPAEAQSWITAIKNAVLSQRAVRAGLGAVSHNTGAVEPRGDMDVMLSMRRQGMLGSPTSSTFSNDISGSPSTQRSAGVSRSPSTAVSALRGLFSPTARPRSPSIASNRGGLSDEERDDTFGRVGTNIMSLMRSNSVAIDPSVSTASPPLSSVPSTPSTPTVPEPRALALAQLDRKIIQDPDRALLADAVVPNGHMIHIANPHHLEHVHSMERVGSPSLQPPPRRRAYTASGAPMGPRARPESSYMPMQGHVMGTLGGRPSTSIAESPTTPTATRIVTPPGDGSPSYQDQEGQPRTSISSMSSSFISNDRTSSEFGGPSSKRWSRQGILPHRLTPPSGPPPAIPLSTSPQSFRSSMQRHPYATEGSPELSPSAHSSPQSLVLSIQNFSKRASTSSAHSSSTVSTSQSHSRGSFLSPRPRSSHRTSMPPPQRPAPLAALPPTPTDGRSAPSSPLPVPSPPSSKISFRESLSLRSNRLSIVPPSTPPATSLPPRPDEIAPGLHRRTASSGSSPYAPLVAPLVPPHPPPTGPLPPPPSLQPSRTTSIRQRLRMLSAPTPTPPPLVSALFSPNPPSPAPSTINPYALPPTPIRETINPHPNDPSFVTTPPTPVSPVRPPSPEPPLPLGPTSLSPPPRRGGSHRVSSQLGGSMHRRPSTADATSSASGNGTGPISLSPSAVSLVDIRV